MRKGFFVFFVALFLFLMGCEITGQAVAIPSEDDFDYELLFCNHDDCRQKLKNLFNTSDKIECALYNLEPSLIQVAQGKDVKIVTDNYHKQKASFIRKDNSTGLMHNKFCIFDDNTILSGSYNPSSSFADANNMIVIRSTLLAGNYKEEFNELWDGKFNGGLKTVDTKMVLGKTLLENYFCPEDSCGEKVKDQIKSANKSIVFMAYSFTHRGIANELVIRSMRGVNVQGVIDTSSDRAIYGILKEQGINVQLDTKKGLLHHKVFIIDNSTVILGSFNPTYSGDTKNDENILIIHNNEIAAKFLAEFSKVKK